MQLGKFKFWVNLLHISCIMHINFAGELPTLFLSKDEKAILHNAIILDPQWLAEVMTKLMKETSYSSEHNAEDICLLLNKGMAKQSFLKSLWIDYLSDQVSQERSFQQLCLFLQAFCLIIPASSVNITTSQESLYLIPCKLQRIDEPPESPPNIEECIKFYFDFKGYLPAEIFHRFFCLLARETIDQPRQDLNIFQYNHCKLWMKQGTLWLKILRKKNILKGCMK